MLQLLRKTKKVVHQLTTIQKKVTAREIKDDFYAQAEILLQPISDVTSVKCKRAHNLRKAGLTGVSDYEDCKAAETLVNGNKNAVMFSNKYPSYKLITTEQAESICKKYGLLLSEVRNYKGEIPNKNLESILELRLDNADYPCIVNNWDGNHFDFNGFKERYGEDLLKEVISANGEPVKIDTYSSNGGTKYDINALIKEMSNKLLFIAAPPSMFDGKNKEIISGYLLVDKDPVILFRVNAGYIIVTAWGDEAAIPEIVNEKMN